MMKRAVVMVAALGIVACSGNEDDPSNVKLNNAQNNVTQNNVTQNNGAPNNAAPNNADATVFYYEHVKPIIDAKCAACHSPGAIGPFSLTNYEEVFAVRELVQTQVSTGTMPPFVYDTGCREYTHDPTLSDDQKQAIVDWVDQGAAEGDAAGEGAALTIDLPEPPTVDTTISMPEPYTPRLKPDDYRCFVADWPHDTTKFVTGFGATPGEDAIVHHVIAFLIPPRAAAEVDALDAADDGPGYTCFGDARVQDQQRDQSWLGAWAPGGIPMSFPSGTGVRVEPGSKIVIQLHYNTLATDPIPDLTSLGFETADTVTKEAFFMPWANPAWLSGNSMNIPAGDSSRTHSFMLDPTQFVTNGQPFKIWAGGLHMHLLGTSISAWIQRADGTEDCLVSSPRWDFNWQGAAQFQEPAVLNPGDRLGLECTWDNSASNQVVINGERLTPNDVAWGEGTRDEMCLGVFYITL